MSKRSAKRRKIEPPKKERAPNATYYSLPFEIKAIIIKDFADSIAVADLMNLAEATKDRRYFLSLSRALGGHGCTAELFTILKEKFKLAERSAAKELQEMRHGRYEQSKDIPTRTARLNLSVSNARFEEVARLREEVEVAELIASKTS